MNRRYYDIALIEHLVGYVEAAVLQYVDLHPGQHFYALDSPVGLSHYLDVGRQLVVIQSPGDSHGLGVVGYGDVFIAHLLGCRGHFARGVAPVRSHGVHMQIAFDVTGLDQPRQLPLIRRLEFAGVFPQLGRDEGEADSGEDLLLGLSAQPLGCLHIKYAVFAYPQSHPLAAVSYDHIMILGTSEIVKRCPVILPPEYSQIGL